MASDSLAKTPSKLNRSRREIALYQDLILAGGQMAKVINSLEPKHAPKYARKAARRWSALMVILARSLL